MAEALLSRVTGRKGRVLPISTQMMLKLRPETKLVWSAPDSAITPFCSVVGCQTYLDPESVPLTMWRNDGGCVHFCDDCVAKYVVTA